jgi:hypothetical protein
MEEMVPRGVYRIHSRNLVVGVWDGVSGFIGIREKFGNEYLFKEYHWDTGAPYGTVKPLELLTTLPEEIDIREHFIQCPVCNRDIAHKPGEWSHADDGSMICDGVSPVARTNQPLFDFLLPLDAEVLAEERKKYKWLKD